MAGGKETPRQKMIGMMYLVLTALLALQVSNVVLEKFIFINKSLERSKDQTVEKNANTVDRIEKAVEEAGNREEDREVLEKARVVRERTGEVLSGLEQLKEEFVQITGGVDENGNYKGVKNTDEVANLMINKGRGEELKETLNQYTDFLGEQAGLSFEPIALDASENPVFADDPNQNMKDFSELTFQNTPMVAGLASLSQLQTEVVSSESRALDELARQVGAADLKFDQIEVMARPQSNVVAAGTKYSAEIFIAASSSATNPSMRVNGNEIPVQGGMGQFEVTASADSYNEENRARKSYEASITINNQGRDTTFTESFEYFVTKPVIQVQSASVQALYLNCGNQLSVQVPALGTSYNPSFSVEGGDAIPGSKTGEVTVVPNAPNVDLSVSSNGNFIGTESFRVKQIPKPDLEVFKPNGDPVNKRQGESASQLRGLELRAIPDPSFKEFLPRDARYRITEAVVTLARGSRPVGNINVGNQQANLNNLSSQAQEGDRYVIEIKEVQRMNFRDQIETVNMGGDKVIQVPLN